jgi:chromosome segregation ATPase
VQEAQDRLEERRHQEQLTQDREKLDNNMVDLDNRIEYQSSSRLKIASIIDRLKKRRTRLMKELSQVDQDLKTVEQKLADLPGIIAAMQEQRDSIARQAQALHSQEHPIPGSAVADRHEIEVVEKLRLDLIKDIHLLVNCGWLFISQPQRFTLNALTTYRSVFIYCWFPLVFWNYYLLFAMASLLPPLL